jgi:hypothetical protein
VSDYYKRTLPTSLGHTWTITGDVSRNVFTCGWLTTAGSGSEAGKTAVVKSLVNPFFLVPFLASRWEGVICLNVHAAW